MGKDMPITPTSYQIATPEEAARNLGKYKAFGRDNWFNRHRFEIVSNYLTSPPEQTLLDFGCGNGLFFKYLQQHNQHLLSSLSLSGYDPYFANTASQEDGVNFYSSIDNMPTQFDFITALDVIEHTENDKKTLRQIHALLAPDSTLLLTVPAYQCLYSLHDAAIGHYRRYTKKSLSHILSKAGFSVVYSSYFLVFLIPPVFIRKYYLVLKKYVTGKISVNDLPTDPMNIFSLLSNIELKLIKNRISLPCGSFIFCCARKNNTIKSE